MSKDSEIPEKVPNSLDEIVAYCQRVQQIYSLIGAARRSRREYEAIMVNICRKCSDQSCPDSCEVKKAYKSIH